MFVRDLHNLQNTMDRMFDSMMSRYDQSEMGSMMGDMGSMGFDDHEMLMGDSSMDQGKMLTAQQGGKKHRAGHIVRRGESEMMHDRAGMHSGAMMPSMMGGGMMGKMNMKMSPIDLKEGPNEYLLTCELAGCDRKSIDIAADKDKKMVTIRAEKREEHHEGNMPMSGTGTTGSEGTSTTGGQMEGQAAGGTGTVTTQGDRSVGMPMGHRYLRQELSYGMVERSLRIPDDCDFDHADAQFENGVLKVRIPRIAKAAQEAAFTQKIHLS